MVLEFCSVTLAHMLGLLYESHGAAIWLTIDRAPQVKVQHLFMADPLVTARSHQKFVLDKMTRREGTSKSNSVVATGHSAARTSLTQMYDSPRKLEPPPDLRVRFSSRQVKVTRREGTSKSNCVDARRRFAAKANVAQMGDSPRKIEPAPDPAIRFGSRQVKVQHLFMADPPVTARSHQQFVLDKFWWDQGLARRPIF